MTKDRLISAMSHFCPPIIGECPKCGDTIFKGVCCLDSYLQMCIPYNDETKHLIGTTNDCPDYYKWWEE